MQSGIGHWLSLSTALATAAMTKIGVGTMPMRRTVLAARIVQLIDKNRNRWYTFSLVGLNRASLGSEGRVAAVDGKTEAGVNFLFESAVTH